MVKINGVYVETSGQSVMGYLCNTGYVPTRVAIELNGEILPKAQYENTILHDGDCVEIVCFVGGG